ncbi:hypothetical protein [Flavobacterium sp. FlaQc-48]|uniref:hypothetical protein n=1 Tax=Flavobacterium sp. FlaQc-48 TaxID=3374181 RepID=UPI003757A413
MAQFKEKTSETKTAVTAANLSQGTAAVQLKDNRPIASQSVTQLVKVHHDPTKKKYLGKGVGAKQVAVSKAALAIKKASPVPISNKEAKRRAK